MTTACGASLRVGDTTLSLRALSTTGAIQRTAFTRALRVIQALNTAAIDLIITEFKFPTILLLGRSSAFPSFDLPTGVAFHITTFTRGACEFRKEVRITTAKILNASIGGGMTALPRRTISVTSANGAHATVGDAAKLVGITDRAEG
tara:strand:+ start:744 stop:1184 length:441 start_codon:yes stop_codon:yes gene_type:complete